MIERTLVLMGAAGVSYLAWAAYVRWTHSAAMGDVLLHTPWLYLMGAWAVGYLGLWVRAIMWFVAILCTKGTS